MLEQHKTFYSQALMNNLTYYAVHFHWLIILPCFLDHACLGFIVLWPQLHLDQCHCVSDHRLLLRVLTLSEYERHSTLDARNHLDDRTLHQGGAFGAPKKANCVSSTGRCWKPSPQLQLAGFGEKENSTLHPRPLEHPLKAVKAEKQFTLFTKTEPTASLLALRCLF